MNIGQKIKEVRKQKSLTQKELGKRAGISQQQIAQYENGKLKPKIETIDKIAVALGVDASDLLGYQTIVRNNHVYSGTPYAVEIFNKIADIADEKTDLLKQTINSSINLLNQKGQVMVAKYAEDLTKIPEYTRITSEENVNNSEEQNK